jgi:hypothetical protein
MEMRRLLYSVYRRVLLTSEQDTRSVAQGPQCLVINSAIDAVHALI